MNLTFRNIPTPPADAKLPELETRIKAAVSEALDAHGLQVVQSNVPLSAQEDVAFLFVARYNIERELRRIAEGRQAVLSTGSALKRSPNTFQITRYLTETEGSRREVVPLLLINDTFNLRTSPLLDPPKDALFRNIERALLQ